ncbi:unnamed protein product, partial [marine sediment metagenome]
MIVGDTLAMKQIMSILPRVANSPVPIMITGESGTG